ncbi:hypothetical protein ONS95_002733 [Cadophora gregata]|uniref:uncharacterized protein n=1 Tax=Cadophora gregata TaxID=51156 RepID=UPI0026DB63EC|nr:uncharacterized protein ONS95_002733 [Cadophora gregata]KAK0110077.1 hypothetical protein ONS95_002733 [Cadophora gregata]KAK0110304.1 hypothetical protein ONS96_001922 [Cadophora gregata f. sp. sojae]
MSSTADCKSISPECPIEDTIYGYYPNLGANVVMVAIFAICAIAQLYLGFRYKLRAYPAVVFLGCLGECVGYVGRVLMHSNPWDSGPFIIQILLLIVSPSLLAAGLYLTLKHLVLHFGPEYSRLSPKWYTWLFVACDAIGFLTQCIGGGIQASADNTDQKTLNMGNNIMVAGVSFQAATMVVCGLLAADFAYSLYRHRGERKTAAQGTSPRGAKAFQFYLACFVTAFLAILTRCIYRIPEMAGGWKNHLMRDEVGFMILDGAQVDPISQFVNRTDMTATLV